MLNSSHSVRRGGCEQPLDRRGYTRSPITLPEYRQGRPALNKGRKFPAEPLSKAEMLRLLDACGPGRTVDAAAGGFAPRDQFPAARRNRALLVVLWRSGLRIAEALALYPHDVDLEEGRIRVLHGKNDQARTVGLDRQAQAMLEEWLRERAELGFTGATPLFCVIEGPSRGQPVASPYVRGLLKKLAARAGIYRRVSPHGLRHTHAFELAGEGIPVHYIRRQLGHSSLAITATYIEHLRPDDVIGAIRGREWSGLG